MSRIVEISSGQFSARLLSKGAALSRFQYGKRDLILGFSTPENHQKIPIYAGAIVGPVANRISGGHVEIDHKTHEMQRNENDTNALHSGDFGLHARDWQVINQRPNQVEFECVLPDGACGLPGERAILAQYMVDEIGLQLTITATSNAKTPINIAHHPYWALGNDQASSLLQIAAQHYLATGFDGLPKGSIDQMAGTSFDFRTPRAIGPGSTLDHNFCIGVARHAHPRFAARLIAADGLTLDIETTEPGLQVYTGSGLPFVPENTTFATRCQPNAAIALEPQGWPDAPNNQKFPNIFIGKEDTYKQITRYRIYQAD